MWFAARRIRVTNLKCPESKIIKCIDKKRFKLFGKIWIHCRLSVFDNDLLHFTNYDTNQKSLLILVEIYSIHTPYSFQSRTFPALLERQFLIKVHLLLLYPFEAHPNRFRVGHEFLRKKLSREDSEVEL